MKTEDDLMTEQVTLLNTEHKELNNTTNLNNQTNNDLPIINSDIQKEKSLLNGQEL